MKRFLSLIIIFIVLNILDAHSTYKVVKKLGLKSEKNPVARFFMKIFGPKRGMAILKTIILIIIPLAFVTHKENKWQTEIIFLGANLAYLGVVLHNYKIAARVKNYCDFA